MSKTVYLGMSGGVDSSVAAVLLKEQGYKVVGVYMKNWSRNLPGMKCPWAEDLADAKRVAVKLGIDFQVFDFETEYKHKVVDYMLAEFKKGNTPNPDIMCNQEIKFKLFYDVAREKGADFIATGHYARVGEPKTQNAGREPGRSRAALSSPALLKAVDENKDQTYFLYRISDDALAHTLFPIGGMLKPDVKKLAEEKGLANAYKKESMGVCFVGEVGIKDFLKSFISADTPGATPGEIKDEATGQTIGTHDGAIFYTIGQRHGLNVGGGLPYYVVGKDLAKNIVYVSQNLDAAKLWTTTLNLKDVIVRGKDATASPSGSLRRRGARIDLAPVTTGREVVAASDAVASLPVAPSDRYPKCDVPLSVDIRLRHRAPLVPATLIFTSADTATLTFEDPIKSPAPGQSAVFYQGDVCLGGGIIE